MAQRCSLVWIPSTVAPPDTERPPAHRYSPMISWHSSLLAADMLASFPMHRALPGSEYYEASAPPAVLGRRRTCPPHATASRRAGQPQAVPVFTVSSVGQVGVQLYPGSLATPTPQTFDVASPPTLVLGFGVDPTTRLGVTHC